MARPYPCGPRLRSRKQVAGCNVEGVGNPASPERVSRSPLKFAEQPLMSDMPVATRGWDYLERNAHIRIDPRSRCAATDFQGSELRGAQYLPPDGVRGGEASARDCVVRWVVTDPRSALCGWPTSRRRVRPGVAELVNGSALSVKACADSLNGTDVALIQHEYGIYGGSDGEEVIDIIEGLRIPSIVVAHTVLKDPTPHQRWVLETIAAKADGWSCCPRLRANDCASATPSTAAKSS